MTYLKRPVVKLHIIKAILPPAIVATTVLQLEFAGL
jgi:hypothetical protein